ncbi:hypothetical protein JCM11641_005242 [Rhodosporidiobolus odoratus]
MATRPAVDSYQLLEQKTPQTRYDGDSESEHEEENEGTHLEDDGLIAEGHAYEERVKRTPPLGWRHPGVVVSALSIILLGAFGASLAVPTSRQAVLSTVSSAVSSFSPLASQPPRVERNPNVTLSDYLHLHFNPEKDVVMWTMATADYVPPARNWDAKRAELGMEDSVVVMCLDEACLDEAERNGLWAYGGYLEAFVDLPPPTQGSRRVRRGKERGHFMAYTKFKAMLEMAKTGFPSLFFEGDTFLTADPFPHMLPLSDPSWDIQFTEDIGYVVNFGWIFARPSPATVQLWQLAFNQYCTKNEWDQQLLSNLIRAQGGREWAGLTGKEHWWMVDSIELKLHMLPLAKFQATHTVMLEWFKPDPALPEPIMNHLTALFIFNRRFYPRERGWTTNLDSYYTSLRPILTSSPLIGTLREIVSYSRILQVTARELGWALMIPPSVTVLGEGENEGKKWERDWSRVVSVEAAMTNHLDLLESSFFPHSARYLPPSIHSAWSDPSHRTLLNLSSSSSIPSSLPALLEHLSSTIPIPIPIAASKAHEKDLPPVVELQGWTSEQAAWTLEGVEEGVEEAFKGLVACEGWDKEHLPFPYCKGVAL